MDCFLSRGFQRIASEVCLIDQNSGKASAEAEDIQHAGIFLGCPLVTGTSGILLRFHRLCFTRHVTLNLCALKSETISQNFIYYLNIN